MGAITDLWKSERGVVAIAMLLLVSIAFFLGHLTADQWLEQTKWVFVTYTGAKTATSVVAALKHNSPGPTDHEPGAVVPAAPAPVVLGPAGGA